LLDPSTAEIDWNYAQTLDPYGDGLPLLPQQEQVGRAYLVRPPDSDIWVNVGDLPVLQQKVLLAQHVASR
jgi:hypothetical protein